MTGEVKTIVEGDENLRRTLDNAASELEHMDRAATAAGQLVKQSAAANAPVDTGALARSIYSEVHGPEVTVGAAVEYAAYVEYGTIYVPASPYLRPALEAATAQIVEEYREDVEKILGKVEGT